MGLPTWVDVICHAMFDLWCGVISTFCDTIMLFTHTYILKHYSICKCWIGVQLGSNPFQTLWWKLWAYHDLAYYLGWVLVPSTNPSNMVDLNIFKSRAINVSLSGVSHGFVAAFNGIKLILCHLIAHHKPVFNSFMSLPTWIDVTCRSKSDFVVWCHIHILG